MRITSFLVVVTLAMTSCSRAPQQGAYITYLGSDTLAAEQFAIYENRVEATVMLRTPETSLRQYILELDEAGLMDRFEATVRDPASPEAPPLRKDLLLSSENGFVRQITEAGETRTDTLESAQNALPFLDMIHWPFEIMLQRAYQSDQPYEQPLIVGRRVMPFELRRLSPDSMTIKHPFRGTMGVNVDEQGQLQLLDAGQTTRKVRVVRKTAVDVAALASQFSSGDAAGATFGPLSGRHENTVTLKGATITVDFGTPAKRGRTIFGALVPYGQIWRTGANQATHFTTDRDLMIGEVDVPAGTYTLYSIPEADGGLLIINMQTGQGGTTYNEDRDLGRIPMTRETLLDSEEIFNIAIEEKSPNATLQLRWDQTAYSVPLTVKN